MCRDLKLPRIKCYRDAEKWFGLLPIHPWMLRTKHSNRHCWREGLNLSFPRKSKLPSQTQASWLERGWGGEKREGRRRNQAWRTRGKTGTASNAQLAAWSGARNNQVCQGQQSETGLINRLKMVNRRGKWEQVQQKPVRCELKGSKNSQKTGRTDITESLACSKSPWVLPYLSCQQNPSAP